AQADIFTLPCLVVDSGDRDGIPNVLAEGMAMELPVVSTSISGIPEIVEHDVNGLLIEQKDALALANALEQLLLDAELRHRLGQAARATILDVFDSWQTTVALRDLFTSELEKRAQSLRPQPSRPDNIHTSPMESITITLPIERR
ncbi:MAG: glycosyltransferase, partial [Caldilineaceae bacterium]|nr:glycosyltransferase [Caldilineaceae bacterium]